MENPNAILGPYYTRLICSQSELARSNVHQRAGLLMTKIAFLLKILIAISSSTIACGTHSVLDCLAVFPFLLPTRSKAPNRIRCLPPPIPFIAIRVNKEEDKGLVQYEIGTHDVYVWSGYYLPPRSLSRFNPQGLLPSPLP